LVSALVTAVLRHAPFRLDFFEECEGWTEEQTGDYTEDMTGKQGIWTAMILSGYAKRLGITVSEAAGKLLSDGGLGYLEDCYGALHTQSNEDVIDELIDMAAGGTDE